MRNKEIQKLLQKKDIALQTIQKQLEENHLLIDSLTETIQTLENDNLSQLEIYKQQQEEANIEQSKLLKEKETILKQKEELISNKDILLRQKDTQLQSILEKNGKLEQRILLSIKEKEELERQRSVLSQELDANVKAQKQLSLDWESLRLQQQEVAGELKQKSRMYEAWIQKLIHQDEFLLNLSDNRQQLYPLNFNKDVFYEHFSSVFPGFVEYLFIQYKLDERELLICCLVKLGVKTGKIATILNLAPDTITKQKAEIKEKYFNVSEKQSLDRFLEKLLW